VVFDGVISGMSGSCPSLRFVAAGRVVVTNKSTNINGGPCKDLGNGVDVEITGTLSSGIVAADRVRFNKK